jgi:hypothetical protein
MNSAARCLGWGRDDRRMAGAGCPWCLGSAGEERRWWSRGAGKGAGKEVGRDPSIGAELRAVTGSLEGDRGWRFTMAQ